MKSLQKITLILALAGFLITGSPAAEELIHVVGKGETIYSISRFYRVSSDDLMRVNNISDPSKLQVGRKLTIPSSAFAGIEVSTGTPENTSLVDYRIVRGDTLFSIARTNGITLQNLLEINKFQPNHIIKAGDVIKIPVKAAVSSTIQSSASANSGNSGSILHTMRWPVNAKGISYMTGQMGVIVEGEYNESVKSLTRGKVISAGPWRKFGKVAIVEVTEGYFYMYGGCESLSVNVGDRISIGTELGKLGTNSVSERPQLFFMVFRDDNPIDPATIRLNSQDG